ncbi:MAG: Lrp/AsnC family transcriptional regulator [Trueperaceae bacterium]|nr:Lrp/AsnC family transcriptional regulator [Trueperaceae bacterium]
MRIMQLDELDKQIIMALESDGRRPYRDIARDLDTPEATIRSRVGRLIDSGLIRITAVGDPQKLGVSVNAISLIRVKPGTIKETAELLSSFPNVRFVGTSFGSADIIIQTLHASTQELHRFISEEVPQAAPAVTSTETFQLAEVLKSSWDWREWFRQESPKVMS